MPHRRIVTMAASLTIGLSGSLSLVACSSSVAQQPATTPKVAAPSLKLPTAPTPAQIAQLCNDLYDSEAGAECRVGDMAQALDGVAQLDVTAVQGDYSHLLMAHADGSWHAVLELPDNGDQQGAHIETYAVEHKVALNAKADTKPLVEVMTSHEAVFKGTDGKTYTSYSNHTSWCAWLPAGPKCCGGVTTEAKIDVKAASSDKPSGVAAWKLAVALADGKATTTQVHGKPSPSAAKTVGSFPQCAFPVTPAAAFNDLYGGVAFEK